MKFLYFFLLFTPLLSAETFLKKTCISPSGKSIYEISLQNTINHEGEIVLRYDDQITYYTAIVKRVNDNRLVGVSKFQKSDTGQTQASPWVFTYDYKKKILIDYGKLISACD